LIVARAAVVTEADHEGNKTFLRIPVVVIPARTLVSPCAVLRSAASTAKKFQADLMYNAGTLQLVFIPWLFPASEAADTSEKNGHLLASDICDRTARERKITLTY
jgi:hypothetical protein